jgi:hypothetical protein
MPTLLEMQTAMQASLLHRDSQAVSAMLAANVPADRLDIYRNTFVLTLTRAMRLCFPATERLVGGEFFEGAAQIFIGEHPPRAAWLDKYGGEFPNFLRSFPPAISLPYLGDVAALEWAVSGALHAEDAAPLNIAELGAIGTEDQARIRFIPHPSIRLLRLNYPADVIWRAVLDADEAALRDVNLGSGPIDILVERRSTGVEISRLDAQAWSYLATLCAGSSIEMALDRAGDFDCATALAAHLALGRFAAFEPAAPMTTLDIGREITA